MNIRFWGARGSIPTPLKSDEFQAKVLKILREADGQDLSTREARLQFFQSLPPLQQRVIGGNSTSSCQR